MDGSSLHFWLNEIWHPLKGYGYQFWSGIGSDISELALLAAIAGAIRHFNCHVTGCKRIGHRVAGTSHRACRKHHPELNGPGERTTAAHIALAHLASKAEGEDQRPSSLEP